MSAAAPTASKASAVIAVYDSHVEAEAAVRELQKRGFDMHKLSIVGKDYQMEENVVGYYNTGERMKVWGKTGAFWGGLWGFMFGSAFFFIPGIGPLLIAGPLISWMVGALEGAVLVGGLSALGAGLYGLGIPKDSVISYEAHLKAGKFVVIAHGDAAAVAMAKGAFAESKHQECTEHSCCP